MADLHRTLYQIELLHEGAAPESLSDINYEMTDGHASGELKQVSSETVEPLVMGRLLIQQLSGPDFLLNADGFEDERLCPECGEIGSQKHDDGQVVLFECLNEDCDREDTWEVPRWRTERWDEVLTRPVEFLMVLEDNYYEFKIIQIPVEIRWEGLQAYADYKLLQHHRCIKLIPWNEDPE